MKTQPLRTETNCLNCGTDVPGRYCTNCGQENIIPHETFGHLVKEFAADIVHYDSKIILTFKYLFTKPGFITKEYNAGKRVKFVHPIKLYIFSSFVFFLFYFTLTAHNDEPLDKDTQEEVETARKQNKEAFESLPDSVKYGDLSTGNWFRRINTFSTKKSYDSLQETLPEKYRDNGIQRRMAKYYFSSMNKGLESEEDETESHAREELFHHHYPKMVFILLPLFALYLKWMYRKQKWFYADHAIFSVHIHVFFFLFYLVCTALDALFHTEEFSSWGLIVVLAYLIIALKNTYGQSWGKSLAKGVLLTFVYLVTLLFVFIGFYMVMMFIV